MFTLGVECGICWKVWFGGVEMEGIVFIDFVQRYSPWGGWFHYNPRELLNFHLFGQFATDIRKSPHQQKLLPRCILHGTRPDYDGSIGTACPNPHMFIFKPNDTLISFLPRYRTTYGCPYMFASGMCLPPFVPGILVNGKISTLTKPKYFLHSAEKSWDAN